jgi:16S rRNA (uracil1498-N3)-methyltransferase
MSRTPRVFVHSPLAAGQRLTLEGEAAAHLGRVLRVRAGEPVVLFDGSESEFASEVVAATRRTVELAVGPGREVNRESALELVLLQGVCRNERMDWVVRKATELGVTAIRPVMTERSVVKLDPAKPRGASSTGARSPSAPASSAGATCCRTSCRRCRSPPRSLRTAARPACCSTRRPREGRTRCSAPPGRCACWSAPRAASTSASAPPPAAGYTGIRLGPRILRTETAALTGLTLLQARFGDLG